MGKSLGNTLDPERVLSRCGSTPLRWYLLRDIRFGDDGDIQQQRLLDLVNNDLANTIGNLLNRTIAMARRWFDGVPSPAVPPAHDHPLAVQAARAVAMVDAHYDQLAFDRAAADALELAAAANAYLSETAPWTAIKSPDRRDAVASDLYAVLEAGRLVGVLLAPLLPDLSADLLGQLGCPPLERWTTALDWGGLVPGSPLAEPHPLLQRLELEEPL
jgi:methionyl-tRNA synthetase